MHCKGKSTKYEYIIIILLVISGCRSGGKNLNLIDYNNLNNIEAELYIEIGETDQYLPGMFRDLILVSDGTLIVSDWGKNTIEQFDSYGKHVATIARAGRGPGELSSFFLLFEGKMDSLIVRHRGTTQQADYFGRGEDEIYHYKRTTILEKFSDRFVTLIGPTTKTAYLALSTSAIPNLHELTSDFQNFHQTPVVILDEFENILQDSLHILKIPNPHTQITSSGAMMVYGLPPYQTHDRIRMIKNGSYIIARPDSSAIFFYNNNHELENRITLNIKERPVERNDLDYLFESMNIGDDIRRIMKDRVPEFKPPFLNIWISNNNLLLHTDTDNKGTQMALFNIGGEPEGTFFLSEFDDIRYFRNDKIYTFHKNPELGQTIRIYQLSL